MDYHNFLQEVCKRYSIKPPRLIIERHPRNDVKDSGRYFYKPQIIYVHHRLNGSSEEHKASLLHELSHHLDYVLTGRSRGYHDTIQTALVEQLYRIGGVSSKTAIFIEEICPSHWFRQGWKAHPFLYS